MKTKNLEISLLWAYDLSVKLIKLTVKLKLTKARKKLYSVN